VGQTRYGTIFTALLVMGTLSRVVAAELHSFREENHEESE
jgi:hypothetical protein